MRSTFCVDRLEKSYPVPNGSLTRTPSTRTSVCDDVAPRMNTLVVAPAPPLWTTSRPGTSRRSSSTSVFPLFSICSRGMTVTEADTDGSSSGARVADTTTFSETGA
jgi:hypothetical protein